MSARSVLRAAAIPALASLATAVAASAAPVPFGGNTYDLVFDDQISWTQAQDAAASAGGSLAVISSAEEQAFIERLMLDRNAETGSYWFGIRETAVEGEYVGIDGEALSFSNFAEGEPNDGAGAVGESVGGIYWTRDGEGDPVQTNRRGDWNDLPELGYPHPDACPPETDLYRAGYLVEFLDAGTGDGDGDGIGDGDGDGGVGSGDGDGIGSGDGDGAGNPTPIPIPAAALTFPGTALLAYFASRRIRRR